MRCNLEVSNYYTPHLDKEQYGLKIPPMIYKFKFTAWENKESFNVSIFMPLSALIREFTKSPGVIFSDFFNFHDKIQGVSIRTAYGNMMKITEEIDEFLIKPDVVNDSKIHLLNRFGYGISKEHNGQWMTEASFTQYSIDDYAMHPTYELYRYKDIYLNRAQFANYTEGRLDALFEMLQYKNIDMLFICEPFTLEV